MFYKFLKKIHHQLLVSLMLQKKQSLFNNQIKEIVGAEKALLEAELKSFPKIAVIVLNHNNQAIISLCLDSLIEFNDYDYQIIVVDNQSTDDSVKLIKEKYANKIKLILNSKNGAASGRNLGSSEAKETDYLLFIDSDQGPIEHGWLDTYLKIMSKYKEIGMLGDGGGFFTEKDLTGPTFEYYSDKSLPKKYSHRTNIDYLVAGGAMIRNEVFQRVVGFDEAYDPHIFEDADLSRKVFNAGYQIAYCKDLPIYHLAHSTTKADQNNEDYLRQYAKNAQYFRQKWL